jgi:hypothetical protein
LAARANNAGAVALRRGMALLEALPAIEKRLASRPGRGAGF